MIPKAAASIYWSAGDSGRIDGVDFRLANFDAPETGGVGSVGGAKCEAGRALAFGAKGFVVELTQNAAIEITERQGADKFGRGVLSLALDGSDVGEAGIAAGHLRPWPHRGQTALSAKPDWCSERP